MKEHSMNHETDVVSADLRQAYNRHHIVPLWESMTGKTFGKPQEEAQIWRWRDMQPIVHQTGLIRAEHILDRRVLLMTKPQRHHVYDEAITGQIYCTFQTVLPGERATAHRHAMNALRFVIQAPKNAKSIVDGKDCVMEPGDMIITPGGCWHEHVNDGDEPVVWLDVLDVGLHYLLNTVTFQPGPRRDTPPQLDDATFVSPGIVPCLEDTDHAERGYSPIFRYSWADAQRALEAAPVRTDSSRHVRYANPLTGGPSMDLLDSTLLQLSAGCATRKFSSSASTVCFVKEGRGVSEIGGKTIEWAEGDVFTVPARLPATHTARDADAILFQVSNGEVYRRLGLYNEAFED